MTIIKRKLKNNSNNNDNDKNGKQKNEMTKLIKSVPDNVFPQNVSVL